MSKIKVLADSGSGKGSLPAHRQSLFSVCPHQGERARIPFVSPPFSRGLISFINIHSHGLISPRKFHILVLNLGVSVRSSHEFRQGTSIHPKTSYVSSCFGSQAEMFSRSLNKTLGWSQEASDRIQIGKESPRLQRHRKVGASS